jgi:hypothetical protein
VKRQFCPRLKRQSTGCHRVSLLFFGTYRAPRTTSHWQACPAKSRPTNQWDGTESLAVKVDFVSQTEGSLDGRRGPREQELDADRTAQSVQSEKRTASIYPRSRIRRPWFTWCGWSGFPARMFLLNSTTRYDFWIFKSLQAAWSLFSSTPNGPHKFVFDPIFQALRMDHI